MDHELLTKQLRAQEREFEAATRRSDVDAAAKELQRARARFAVGIGKSAHG